MVWPLLAFLMTQETVQPFRRPGLLAGRNSQRSPHTGPQLKALHVWRWSLHSREGSFPTDGLPMSFRDRTALGH